MIKIIHNSMIEPIEAQCGECKSIFTYNYEDIHREEVQDFFFNKKTRRFLICPVCKSNLVLQNVEAPKVIYASSNAVRPDKSEVKKNEL